MPACLIQDQDGMGTRVDHGADLGKVRLHGGRVAPGHDQARPLALPGTDRAEDIGGLRSLVMRRRRPGAAQGPAAGDLVLLTDPGFVLPPELYLDARCKPAPDFRDRGREVFLKAASASVFWA